MISLWMRLCVLWCASDYKRKGIWEEEDKERPKVPFCGLCTPIFVYLTLLKQLSFSLSLSLSVFFTLRLCCSNRYFQYANEWMAPVCTVCTFIYFNSCKYMPLSNRNSILIISSNYRFNLSANKYETFYLKHFTNTHSNKQPFIGQIRQIRYSHTDSQTSARSHSTVSPLDCRSNVEN